MKLISVFLNSKKFYQINKKKFQISDGLSTTPKDLNFRFWKCYEEMSSLWITFFAKVFLYLMNFSKQGI